MSPSAKKRSAARGPRAAAREARESLYREHILAAAERVFADKAFELAKVQDISQAAGLSMGSIYALFPGKEQIYAAIVDRRAAELLELVRGIAGSGAGPLETLEALAAAYIDYFFARPDFLRMNLRTEAAWALTSGAQSGIAEEIHRFQAGIFARGIEARVFVDEDPAYLAILFSGIDQIHLAHWVAGGMKASRDDLRERLLRIVRKTFLR